MRRIQWAGHIGNIGKSEGHPMKCLCNLFATQHLKEMGRHIVLQPLSLRARLITLFTGGWMDLRASLNGTENVVPTGIRSPDCPALRELLY